MRFRRWPRPAAYRETSRKRAAFLRKQRLDREALPLFAAQIGARQHGVDEEMSRRAEWWDDYERDRRDQRAARWREARARLFALDEPLRLTVRALWRTCPYPADPASFADMLHEIAVGRLDPYRPPWVFHQKTSARITTNPATFADAFRQIGRRQLDDGPNAASDEELLFCGNLGSGILFLTSRAMRINADQNASLSPHHGTGGVREGQGGHWTDIEIRGECPDHDLALIARLAQAAQTRPVIVRRMIPIARAGGSGRGT